MVFKPDDLILMRNHPRRKKTVSNNPEFTEIIYDMDKKRLFWCFYDQHTIPMIADLFMILKSFFNNCKTLELHLKVKKDQIHMISSPFDENFVL